MGKTIVLSVLGTLLVGGLIYGAYFLGTHYNAPATVPAPAAAPTQAITPTPAVTPAPAHTPQPSPTPSAWSTGTHYPGNSPFVAFTTYLLNGWMEQKTTVGDSYKVDITNGVYKITISQAPGGGAACAYPGETPGEMTAVFNAPTKVLGFPDTNREFNRATQGSTAGNQTYLFCQKRSSGYGMPTELGYITYTTPQSPTAEMLGEMDAIIGMFH